MSDPATTLSVFMTGYLLEEDRLVLSVGDTVEWWLILHAVEAAFHEPAITVENLVAEATPVSWTHPFLGEHPTRLAVGAAVLYWGAPAPVHGPTQVSGRVDVADPGYEIPDDFPANRGVIQRLRMQTTPYEVTARGSQPTGAPADLVDVSKTYFPKQTPYPERNWIWTGVVVDLSIARAVYPDEHSAMPPPSLPS